MPFEVDSIFKIFKSSNFLILLKIHSKFRPIKSSIAYGSKGISRADF
jgi:hypothetical protein